MEGGLTFFRHHVSQEQRAVGNTRGGAAGLGRVTPSEEGGVRGGEEEDAGGSR